MRYDRRKHRRRSIRLKGHDYAQRAYIQTNPQRWALDRENPERDGLDELESWFYRPPGGQEGGPWYC